MTVTLYWGVRNYSDRRPKQSLDDATYSTSFDNCNFAENNGVETSLTVNVGELSGVPSDLDFPSYLIANDGTTYTHWYVMGCVKNRQGQLTLALRRNFLMEKWSYLQSLPFLCTRASDISNTAFDWVKYQKATSMNEVKTDEVVLRDTEDGMGWLVGYTNKNVNFGTDNDGNVITNKVISVDLNSDTYDYVLDDVAISSWEHYGEKARKNLDMSASFNTKLVFKGTDSRGASATSYLHKPASYSFNIPSGNAYELSASAQRALTRFDDNRYQIISDIITETAKVISAEATSQRTSVGALEDISYLDGKIVAIRDSTSGTITSRYLVSIKETEVSYDEAFTLEQWNTMRSTLYLKSYDGLRYFGDMSASPDEEELEASDFKYSYTLQTVSVTLISSDSITATMKGSSHVHSEDSLYDVFVIPLGGNLTLSDADGTVRIPINSLARRKSIMAFVAQLYEELGSQLIDLQWLPYGPGDNPYSWFSYKREGDAYRWSVIKQGDTNISALIWLSKTQYQFDVAYGNNDIGFNPNGSNNYQRIWNEEHKVRLVSPNFASQFEFSPVKNNGVNSFVVYVAYKPYSPYVRVAPNFSGLYGYGAKDARGLILSGDFSLDRISDAWTEYKLQNKNYQLIFDRQIQSMDLRYSIQDKLDAQDKALDIFGAVTDSVRGTARGALSGLVTGGPVGAIAGAVVGGGISTAQAVTDTVLNDKTRRYQKMIRDDTRQASIDDFQYQLGNIQAMPDTLTKVSTFNPDYRIYPLLEIFTCTEQDDYNYRESIKWNGFETNVICQLNCFSNGYVQGSILRFDGMSISATEAREINSELEGGIYID